MSATKPRAAIDSRAASAARITRLAVAQWASIPAACAIVACLALLVGCATVPAISRASLLKVAGEGASAYAVVPVRENRPLAERLLSAVSPELARSSSLDLVDCVYAASYTGGGIRAVASGSFGPSLAPFAFSASGGWTKCGTDGLTWYESSAGAATIPVRGVLLYASNPADIRGMMESLASIPPFSLGSGFDAWLAAPAHTGEIGILMNDPAPALKSFLGPDITIPATRMVLYASRDDVTVPDYALSSRLEISDKRASRGIAAMLRLSGAREVTVDDSGVTFSGMAVAAEKLAAMADFVYFND